MPGPATLDDHRHSGAVAAVWTVAAVAERLGVSPSTLRTWARRYGIGPAGHHPGRHRRYTDEDVVELETMCRLVERGVALTAAAALAREQRGTPHADPAGTWAQQVARLVAAAHRLDSIATTLIVGAALHRHGVLPTWDELCRPAIGALAAQDDPTADACVDAVLLLQWSIATSLRRLPGPGAAPVAGPVLLACAEGEHHTLALEALLAALSERHVDARMLGPAVPDFALLAATSTLAPDGVVVWAQTAGTAAPDLLRALSGEVATVVAAGPGWAQVALPPGVHRPGGLRDTLELVGGQHLPTA